MSVLTTSSFTGPRPTTSSNVDVDLARRRSARAANGPPPSSGTMRTTPMSTIANDRQQHLQSARRRSAAARTRTGCPSQRCASRGTRPSGSDPGEQLPQPPLARALAARGRRRSSRPATRTPGRSRRGPCRRSRRSDRRAARSRAGSDAGPGVWCAVLVPLRRLPPSLPDTSVNTERSGAFTGNGRGLLRRVTGREAEVSR